MSRLLIVQQLQSVAATIMLFMMRSAVHAIKMGLLLVLGILDSY